jgi:hypothetical protein
MITIKIDGLKRTVASVGNTKDKLVREGITFPLQMAKIITKNIKQVINSKSYSRHPRHGPYRRASGKGVAEALQAVKSGPYSAFVRVDPGAQAGNTGPSKYVLAMELGGSGTGSRPTYYIKEGIRKGLAEYKIKQKNKQ